MAASTTPTKWAVISAGASSYTVSVYASTTVRMRGTLSQYSPHLQMPPRLSTRSSTAFWPTRMWRSRVSTTPLAMSASRSVWNACAEGRSRRRRTGASATPPRLCDTLSSTWRARRPRCALSAVSSSAWRAAATASSTPQNSATSACTCAMRSSCSAASSATSSPLERERATAPPAAAITAASTSASDTPPDPGPSSGRSESKLE
mmetsp:Transcript_14954/g.37294  ORF Transcript_14954/g.37294 Transcript_14954/m.37294 type:complete len:205 (+) Transcript_14954:2964-3578(+)